MHEFDLTRDRSAINGKYVFGFFGEADKKIAPVLQYRSGTYRIIGTASYFGKPNWFITASHIFEGDDIDANDGFAVHFADSNEPIRLDTKFNIDGTDIALCTLEGCVTDLLGDVEPFAIMNLPPEIGEVVATYGYAHSVVNPNEVYEDENGELLQNLRFRAKWELGGVLKIHPEGLRYVQGECFETSVLAEGRDSGAPMFNSNGFLIGVLSSSFTFEDGLPNSTFTSIIRIGEHALNGVPIRDIWHKGKRSAYCKRLK